MHSNHTMQNVGALSYQRQIKDAENAQQVAKMKKVQIAEIFSTIFQLFMRGNNRIERVPSTPKFIGGRGTGQPLPARGHILKLYWKLFSLPDSVVIL